MPNVAVVGAQWGDEGKGKIVDLIADRFDAVARFQGGPNAGHTVTVGERRHALHHIPSGAFRPGVRLVVGNGTVLDLDGLVSEVDGLERAGIPLAGRFFVSDRAHVIVPAMAALDAAVETQAREGERIGTTRRGIGPAYEAKAGRAGIRVADLEDAELLERRLRSLFAGPLAGRLRAAGSEIPDAADVARTLGHAATRLAPYFADTSLLLNQWMDEGKSVLFEGAQGALLDVDHGSYPFVTSSNTTAGGLCSGLGVAPTRVDGIVGVFKAYSTRVGSGPLPTELLDETGELLRERGREYGTTTGRPRRCGWFDGVAAAYAQRLNRFDAVCVTLLDVLDPLAEIRICTGYRVAGREERAPSAAAEAAPAEAIYETLPGWKHELSAVRRWEDLPAEARRFLERLGEVIGAPVALASVGPERTQSIVRPGSWLARSLGI